jgi:glycosyltransferase 2 family protein
MKSSPKDKSNKTFWLRLSGTLLALALLVYLLGEQGWNEILLAMQKIALWQLLAALALNLVSRMAICGRWHVLLRGANLRIRFSQTTRITFAGLFASNFLPTTIGGDVVRLAGAVQLRFDSAISTASLVVDRLVGMAGMAMALPFGLPAFSATFFQSQANGFQIFGLSGVVIPRNKRLQNKLKNWSGALITFIQRMLGSLKLWVTHPGSLIAALGFTWIHMLCLFASIWLLLYGLGEPVSFWLIAGMWSVVYFITLVPISINGYGLQEVSLAFIFTRVAGVSTSSALTLAILFRTIFMIASLPGALFVPGIMAARSSTSSEIQRSAEKSDSSAADINAGNP